MNTLDMLAVDGDVVTLYDHTLEYAFTVDNEVEQATITATAADSRSAVSIIPPDADESKENGHQVMLEVGETTIAIVVTPEDSGALQGNYAIMITRLPDTTAPKLTAATVDSKMLTLTYDEALDEDFRPATRDFKVNVVDSVTRETSSPKVLGVAVGATKVILTLTPTVRYQDRVTLAYTPGHNPIRDAAGNNSEEISNRSITNDTQRSFTNTLSVLSLRGVILTPEFAPSVTSYTADVASDVNHIDISVRATGPRATVAISPSDSNTGDGGHQAPLSPGRNNITVVVIPENAAAAQGKYTIIVHRAHPAPVPTPRPASTPASKPGVPILAAPTPHPVPTRTYTPVPTFLPTPTPTFTPRPTNTPTPTPVSTPTSILTPTPTGTPTPTPKPAPRPSPTPTVTPIPLATQTPTPAPTPTLQRDTGSVAGPVERSTPVWGITPIPMPVEAPPQTAFTPAVIPTPAPRPRLEVTAWEEISGVHTPTPEPTPLPFEDAGSLSQPANRSSLDGPAWLVILVLSGLLAWRIHQRFRRRA